jgi:predicted esterase
MKQFRFWMIALIATAGVPGAAVSAQDGGAAAVPAAVGTVQRVDFEGPLAPRQVDRATDRLFAGYEQPRARYTVDAYLLRVYTRYPNGRLTPIRVQVFIPRSPAEPDAVYVFSPGSTGLVGPCRASREHIAGIRWGLYRNHVLAFAGQGMIAVLPDYMGFEDPDLVQPYFHAASEARVVFDSLHALHRWLTDHQPSRFPNGLAAMRRVAAGFSQGGHAAFAAADRNALHGGRLYLHGVIGYGPTAEIEPMLQRYPSLGPMVAMSYFTVYGRSSFNPRRMLLPRWAGELAYDTTRQCVGGIQRYYPSAPEELYAPRFLVSLRSGALESTHPLIHRIFEANRTGLARHGVPTLILQGTNDIVVSKSTQDRYVEQVRTRGNPVDYRVYDGARHDTRQVAFRDVLTWVRALEPNERPSGWAGPVRFDMEIDR